MLAYVIIKLDRKKFVLVQFIFIHFYNISTWNTS